MYSHNYKGLPYRESCKQFIKDYRFRYLLYGRNSLWETKQHKKIKVKNLHRKHLVSIVDFFGCTYIRNNFPFIYYRYLKLRKV